MKSQMHDPAAPFGVDLLLPAVGGNARATNYDYTKGQLGQLIDVVIEEKARLFVTAVGVPPSWVVEKLHENGILVMNMVGSPKHCKKALDVGVDGVVAQGSEAGGHTGDVATFPLIPQCVDLVAGRTSTLTGGAFGKRTACAQPHTRCCSAAAARHCPCAQTRQQRLPHACAWCDGPVTPPPPHSPLRRLPQPPAATARPAPRLVVLPWRLRAGNGDMARACHAMPCRTY